MAKPYKILSHPFGFHDSSNLLPIHFTLKNGKLNNSTSAPIYFPTATIMAHFVKCQTLLFNHRTSCVFAYTNHTGIVIHYFMIKSQLTAATPKGKCSLSQTCGLNHAKAHSNISSLGTVTTNLEARAIYNAYDVPEPSVVLIMSLGLLFAARRRFIV